MGIFFCFGGKFLIQLNEKYFLSLKLGGKSIVASGWFLFIYFFSGWFLNR